ncbi:MAG: hypothetical protein QME32_02615 [Endomicrobiia bacterium]|nr:hypothetical protein [Endomicrobiia bacterium]
MNSEVDKIISSAIEAARETSADAYFVGGCVRDAALGISTKDVDAMVVGAPESFVAALEKRLGLRAVRHAKFGTFVFRASSPELPGLDVATSREEIYERPGALPSVRIGAPLEKDLARRDFSVNAMAMKVSSVENDLMCSVGKIIDPFGGSKDLAAGLLRVLHPKSFFDDPTRIVRAARFAARFGFLVEAKTLSLIRDALSAGAASTVSAARAGKELELLSREPEPLRAFALLESWRAASAFFPEIFSSGSIPEGPALAADYLVKYAIPRRSQKSALDFISRVKRRQQ